MRKPLWVTILVVALNYAAQAAPLGPELVTNGSFETFGFVGWSNDFWGNDAPPHSGVRGAFSIGESLGASNLDQVISGLQPGEAYLISFWAGNSFQSSTPNSNGIFVSFGVDSFSVFDVGEPYQEFSFTATPSGASESLHITGFNDPRAFFLDDVSVRQVLPDPAGAPELGCTGGLETLAGALLLLALASSRVPTTRLNLRISRGRD